MNGDRPAIKSPGYTLAPDEWADAAHTPALNRLMRFEK